MYFEFCKLSSFFFSLEGIVYMLCIKLIDIFLRMFVWLDKRFEL